MDELKVITLGESGVGKTAIINRFANNTFDENSMATLGINIISKEIKLDNEKIIPIKVIDTAGQEKYKALTKSYFKNIDAVLFVFSIDKKVSFNNIKDWIKIFDENHNDKDGILKYLVGSKSDLDREREIDIDLVNQFINKYPDFKYYETSAKSNEGIEELFKNLGEDFYKNLDEYERNKYQNTKKLTNCKNKKKSYCICYKNDGNYKSKD